MEWAGTLLDHKAGATINSREKAKTRMKHCKERVYSCHIGTHGSVFVLELGLPMPHSNVEGSQIQSLGRILKDS